MSQSQRRSLLTTYTDLFLIAALYWSFNSGRGLFGDLLIFVLSSLISIKPVLDFLNASTITLKSVERWLNLYWVSRHRLLQIHWQSWSQMLKQQQELYMLTRDIWPQIDISSWKLPFHPDSRLVVLWFYLLNLIITSKGTQPSSSLICSFRNLSLGRLWLPK